MHITYRLSIILFISVILSSCVHLNLPIAQGIIKDDFSINLTHEGHSTTIKSGRFFTLDSLRLTANTTPLATTDPNLLVCYKDGRRSDGKIINAIYPITIKKDGKSFSTSARSQAVTSYYQIAIPEKYFIEASQGRTSCAYEYWKSGSVSYITWIIWLSDAPLKSNTGTSR
jgi:hypothetical protein